MRKTGKAISTILIAIPVIVALSMIVSAIADDMTATHRIVDIIQDGEGAEDEGSDTSLQFITKGDANEGEVSTSSGCSSTLTATASDTTKTRADDATNSYELL